ncbi:alpha-L-rhamnosidase [Agromyces bracchium]|nr:alpha-L-rhamnosidase [Agromyces bracchium]
MVDIGDLGVEHLTSPTGVWTARPRYSWRFATTEHDLTQSAYELEVVDLDRSAPAWRSGRVPSSRTTLVEHGGDVLRSATRYGWRVRSWLAGRSDPTAWAHSEFETTLLGDEPWTAPWIEPEQAPVRPDGAARFQDLHSLRIDSPPEDRLHPLPYVRQRFDVDGEVVRARLYATAHGIYRAEINGSPVSDELFAPGNDSYDRRLSFQVYDVTGLVGRGENVLGLTLSDGWYAGRVGILGSSRHYGERLRATWQLRLAYADGRASTLLSDGTAVSSTDGPLRYADLAVGECFDARVDWDGWSRPGFDDSGWSEVRVVDVDQPLVPFAGEPVRPVLELPAVEIIRTPAAETVVDFGQVIAGMIRFRVRGPRGAIVRLEHSEVLDEHGNFLMNIVGPNKDQTDVYVLAGADDGETWTPTFTFHGFRYARLTGFPEGIRPDDFTAVVTSSDLPVIGEFSCSDERLNRLHQNVRWSQRGNFLSIPTDCPQRERYGWTGDIQVFAPTAATNMAVAPFLSRWLANVRADQLEDGRITNISPDPPSLRFIAEGPPPSYDDPVMLLVSSAGWGDAIAIVPHVLYEHFDDVRVLEENYPAMVAWAEYQIRSAERGLPPRLVGVELDDARRARQRYLWNNEPNFGDWLAPSTLVGPDGDQINAPRRTGEIVGSLSHGHLLDRLSQIASVLGRSADAERFAARASAVRAAFADEYIDSQGRIPGDLQGPYVLALAFDFVPDDLVPLVADQLVELIKRADDHLDTGFLSVPHLLDVLWDTGQRDLARRILFQETAPSWLYEVTQGATTIWEGWEAIRTDGTVTELSFNHYAFGCVDDWIFRRLAGLQLIEPGYRRSRIEPDFECGLTRVSAHVDTPSGRLASSWQRLENGRVELRVDVPPNTTTTIALPASARGIRLERAGLTRQVAAETDLGSGSATVSFDL